MGDWWWRIPALQGGSYIGQVSSGSGWAWTVSGHATVWTVKDGYVRYWWVIDECVSMKSHFQAGYKMRQQISKALQRCSEAIRNAISRYNTQATALNPPRPPISWKDIAEYSFHGEFDLLCHSHADVQDNDWAKPAFRQAMVKFFKLQHAHEELICVSVEIRWLWTSIHKEEAHITKVIDELLISDHLLASELRNQHRLWHAINQLHLHSLDQIVRHPQYVGRRGVGVHLRTSSIPEETNVEEQSCRVDTNRAKQVESQPAGKSSSYWTLTYHGWLHV